MPQYWLLKSEPGTFSIEDLEQAPRQTTCWEGVRNYQARNYLRAMQKGEQAFFYHSNADPPAIVGIVEVVLQAYPDPFAFDPRNAHFDHKSDPANPRWVMVDIRLVRKFGCSLPLETLRRIKGLEQMELLRKGSRLSVQPVREREWQVILKIAEKKPRACEEGVEQAYHSAMLRAGQQRS